MSAQTHVHMSETAYLALERASDQKHEYYEGHIVALAGGSAAHNRITINTIASLYAQLRDRACTVYSSDLRVKIPHASSYVYPDISIVCGQERFADDDEDMLVNPIIIIEVLSPSTERHDRGKKFEYYRTIESLHEYLLVAQDAQRIDHFVRQSDTLWTFTSIGPEVEKIHISSIDCTLTINDIYQKVTFSEQG
jgi:Uma2 family endonuclease